VLGERSCVYKTLCETHTQLMEDAALHGGKKELTYFSKYDIIIKGVL
jgi:hypothetical protein